MLDMTRLIISDGYVGQFGVEFRDATADDLEKAIIGAMEIDGKSREEIVALLESGKSVRWCQSSNFYYDHNYGRIGYCRREPQPVTMVRCQCGHSVPAGQVMSASLGTSCAECYDRMS